MDIGPPELIIVLVVLLVLFGGSKLPQLARNLGKAQQEFKSALAEGGAASASEPAGAAESDPSASTPESSDSQV